MTEQQIALVIDLIMRRRTGSSGHAVYVDPVILRSIFDRVMLETTERIERND
jgi:hypothetical protein